MLIQHTVRGTYENNHNVVKISDLQIHSVSIL